MTAPAASFGELLARFRRRAGLTQQQVADRTGYSAAVISRWEQGVRHPRERSVIESFTDAFTLTEAELNQLLLAAGLAPTTGVVREDSGELRLVLAALSDLSQTTAEMKDVLQHGDVLFARHPAVEPVVNALISCLAQSAYIEHAWAQEGEKKAIAEWIVNHELAQGSRVALDTGSTAVQVAQQIIYQHLDPVVVYTNNFVAALLLLARRYPVMLAGGHIDAGSVLNSYGSVLGHWAQQTCKEFKADVTIVGASGLDPDVGPLAPTAEDRAWKASLVEAAVAHGSKIIVPVDYTKLVIRKSYDKPVFDERQWREYRPRITVVTAGEPLGRQDKEAWRGLLDSYGPQLVAVDVPPRERGKRAGHPFGDGNA